MLRADAYDYPIRYDVAGVPCDYVISLTGDQKWAIELAGGKADDTMTQRKGWEMLNDLYHMRLITMKRLVLEFNLPIEQARQLKEEAGSVLLEKALKQAKELQVSLSVLVGFDVLAPVAGA